MIDAKIPQNERGDALVFLNGISEMTTVAEALKVYAETNKRWIILMLHRYSLISSLKLLSEESIYWFTYFLYIF